jgi:cell wall-associated NlpC family hydrolase
LFALLKQARTGFFITMIGLMLTSVISPVLALAATDLVPGDDAVVLQDTRLYSETSRDADVTAEVAKDTPVSIVEGPFTADDTTQWYWVRVYEQTGYMPADDLEGVAPAPVEDTPAETAADTEVPATRPWQEPIDFGVANDNVICRADSTTSAQELIRVAVGQTIEVTGQEVWVEGIAWLPVNCAGVGGFIASDFITFETATEVATEVVTEVPVETEVVTEVPTEVVTEAPVETEAATEVVTEAPADTQAASEVPAETEAAPADAPAETEAAATEAITASPAGAPIGTAIATDDVVCRVDISTEAAQITVFAAGMTIEITGAPVEAAGLSWTPVNCSGVGGFVATQYIDGAAGETATEATDAATTEPTEEVTDEAAAPSEDTADEAATDEATPEATDEATEEATDEAASTPVVEETATAEPTEAADEATSEPTEEATDEAAAPTEETVDDEATEEASDEAATEESTEEMLDSGQAVIETESTMPVEDSAIIGTATVQGTNGAGIACRTAADGSAPIIRVLPEGMSVLVLSEPDANGWMSIVCNDEVGFAPVTFLWQGGAASDFTADESSYANVTATGGAGLNCRSGPGTNYSVIGYFPSGSGINVRGAAQGDWVPVVCGGQNGWVHGDFIAPATTPSTGDSTDNTTGDSTGGNATGGTMVVSGTNGDSLYCRATPGGTAITLMAPGTRVSVRGATENGWVPIVCAGQNGYASAQFLTAEGGTTDPGTTDPGTTDPGTTDPGTGGTVTVTGTGGVNLNCRTAPNGSIIGSVAEGTVLTVRGATEGGWVPVVCNGANAWVSGLYVTAGGSAPAPNPTPTPDTGTTDPTTGTATVVNTQGDSLRCRVAPNGATITMLAPGSTVTLRAETSGEWQGVICAGQNGFAHSDYLSIGGGSGSTPAPTPTPDPAPAPSGFGNGDHARVTDSLNLRYEPSSGSGVATVAPAGTVVLITGGAAGNGYLPVNWDGLSGYMHGDYLVKTDEALSKRGGSANPTEPAPGGGGGSATGNAIVDYAMGYLGYPYVWATSGPYSFDCSGFTYWVVKNVTGMNIGTGTWSQASVGTPVGRNALQPGDLVFHQNTYTAGLSHVGIYIGNNQMINALNENAGVVISDITSDYWESRWYGARRLT